MSRVICLGEVLFDCIAKELGVSLSEVQSWSSYVGGAPANVATALVKLETSAAFVGCVGEDPLGDSICRYLDQQGVNLNGIQRTAHLPTRQVYVLRTWDGDRIFAGFSQPEPQAFADGDLRATKLPENLFRDADYLVLGTLELAYPQSREAIWHALELADKYYLRIVLDVNHRPVFWPDLTIAKSLIERLLPRVDFLKLSAEEAQWLFTTTNAMIISDRIGSLEGVIVTDGAAAVNYCFGDVAGTVQPRKVTVKDTTGAGDAFVAGLIKQLTQHKLSQLADPLVAAKIITYACAVGSLTTTSPGAIASQPTITEVNNFLNP